MNPHDGHAHEAAGSYWDLFEVFTPRIQCMRYEPDVVWLHFASDLLIAVAYFSIPFALVHFVRRRKDLAFNRMFLLFALFIVLCGFTHLFGIWALWQPLYRLDGYLKLATGLVSAATAILLWRLIPRALKIPSADEIRRMNERLLVEVAERRRGEEELERRVQERTTELSTLTKALRDADRDKDEFLATLAHELRNPLAPVRTGLNLLKLAPGGEQAARVRDMMERQFGHMVRLIDDLLDVARISRGKVTLVREQVTLQDVVASALETSDPLIAAARHTLELRLPEAPVHLFVDPMRLAQVLSNLVSNAAKYTPDGGTITLSAACEPDTVTLQVTDTGVGIPAEMLPRVFEMFTQVGQTVPRAQGGLGIGLALVQQLVALHGGTVAAESPGPGRGSTFTVTIPRTSDARPQPEVAPHPVTPRPTAHRGQRILVVDDNDDGAESLAMVLGLTGYEARTANDGPSALALARSFRPELVFLDIGLPGMNGYEVARRLREDPELARITLVALTGWGSEDDQRRAHEAGFDAHLTKPAGPDAIAAVLDRFRRPSDA